MEFELAGEEEKKLLQDIKKQLGMVYSQLFYQIYIDLKYVKFWEFIQFVQITSNLSEERTKEWYLRGSSSSSSPIRMIKPLLSSSPLTFSSLYTRLEDIQTQKNVLDNCSNNNNNTNNNILIEDHITKVTNEKNSDKPLEEDLTLALVNGFSEVVYYQIRSYFVFPPLSNDLRESSAQLSDDEF